MRMSGAVVAALLVAGGLVAGCSSVQESLECPGDDCPGELRAVADEAATVPDVTGVDRTWRFSNIDKGHSGGVQVHASLTDEGQARTLATAIAAIYRDSEVEAVRQISVRVVPDPEVSEPDTREGTLGSGPSDSGEVECAADSCAGEVASFEAAFADDALGGEATLGTVEWVADDYRPYTSIEVTAPDEVMDSTELGAFGDRVLELAEKAGLTELGQVKTVIHFQKRVEFDFSFDGGREGG